MGGMSYPYKTLRHTTSAFYAIREKYCTNVFVPQKNKTCAAEGTRNECPAMNDYYPEECDNSGSECLACVRRTAEATRALTGVPTPEWASGLFQRMYSYAACRQMEHSFVWACGVQPGTEISQQNHLIQIGIAAA
jgi:hypothetical protein